MGDAKQVIEAKTVSMPNGHMASAGWDRGCCGTGELITLWERDREQMGGGTELSRGEAMGQQRCHKEQDVSKEAVSAEKEN